jgi:hypothetical protein
LFISIAYFSRSLGPTYVLVTITALSFAAIGMIMYLKKVKKESILEEHVAQAEQGTSSITTKVIIKEEAIIEN